MAEFNWEECYKAMCDCPRYTRKIYTGNRVKDSNNNKIAEEEKQNDTFKNNVVVCK